MREAPDRVRDLQALGVRFDADRFGRLALGLEGGHSVRRVVHAGGSATGRRVVRQLSALAAEEPRITVLEGARARALWRSGGRCRGLICDDGRIVGARAVVLGTGGAAALWARTTNPPGSQGVGLLLAHAAGAALADLELLQFHPTAVIGVAGREGFLVTEAIRGEGATLHDASGERFVDELAPRDEVSRAIQARLEQTGAALGRASTCARSTRPTSRTWSPSLREAGLDPTRELVPVAPAAHYTMGGIVADLHARSTLPGLYAVGESSCTGLHGANRLASNSLSECFVFAAPRRLAARCPSQRPSRAPAQAGEIEALRALPPPPLSDASTRAALWRDAGIVRSRRGPEPAARRSPPAGAADRALRARAHREPRRAPAHRPPRARPGVRPSPRRRSPARTPLAWQTWA